MYFMPVHIVMPNKQAHESAYLLIKARRLHDATLRLSHAAAGEAAMSPSSAATQDHPAYLAQRVARGRKALLPGVEVIGLRVVTWFMWALLSREPGEKKRVFEQVVRHVVEGLSVELVRELMEM
jgi:hypothetical protein